MSFLVPAFLDFAGPVTLALVLLWAFSIWRLAAPRWQERKKEWGITGLFALAGTGVAFLSTTVDFKVLSDETNLLSVANMLAIFGKASNTEMWTYYYHTFHAIIISVPSRPILFPVLTAVAHALVGMRDWNPFLVNFLCLAGLFFLFLGWARKVLPVYARWIAAFSLLMNPVLLIVATSAGFDLCSLFFALLSCVLLQKYLADKSERALDALVYTVICFASVRYESILALPLLFAGLWWANGRKLLAWRYYGIAGFFVLPLLAQRILTWGSFENPPGVAPFSLGHFADHFMPFAKAFFLDLNGPYPVLLHWLGLGGLFYLCRRPRIATLLPLAYGAFLFVLLLSHHFGYAGHPTQVRLFLPLTLGLSALAIYFVAELKAASAPLLGVFVVLFAHHHQFTMHDPLSTQLTMTREVRLLRDFLRADGKRDDLYIYDRPGQLMAFGESAISWDHFKQNQAEYLSNLRNRLYGRIILIERVKYAGPGEEFSLERAEYNLTSLTEHQLSPTDKLRLASVVLK